MGRIKERAKICTLSSFFLVFTFFGFGTLELFMSNREEFWFSYNQMLSVIVIFGVLLIAVCIIILMLLPNNMFKYGIAIINGFTLTMYIQGNYLPNDYGVLDGTAIEWENYQGRLLYNSIIWCVLILLVILFAKKREKMFFSASKIVIGVILATQIVTLITVGLMLPKRSSDSILSVNGQFDVSNRNNTIVFVLDCFDSELFGELLKEYPSAIEEMFEDFTFYHNMVGGATRTKCAIPYIFTGQTNTGGGTYTEYVRESFAESPLIKELQTGKYDARVYTESAYIDMQQQQAIDNISYDTLYPTSKWGLTRDFLKVTAFRYAPHIMKKYFWLYSGDFDFWKEKDVSYVFDDSAFYEKLKTENVKSSINKDVFRFYHLTGAHPPYTMNDNCERVDSDQGSEQGQGLGALKIVSEFIEQLKALDAYENSTIFVVADHGARGYEQNPLFMVKQKKKRQEFQQSEISLSYKNFPDMMVDALVGQKVNMEKDYACSGERYFYVGYENNYRYSITEYASEGAAYDAENFYQTGQVFWENANESYKYPIGKKLSFAEDATANIYCKSGFHTNELTHTWSGKGKAAEMYFELEGEYDNLLLEIEYAPFNPPQKVKIYANANIIADYDANGYEQKQIIIPKEYVEDGVLDLAFEFPNAISPVEIGYSEETREIALCMYSMCISSTKDKEMPQPEYSSYIYKIGEDLSFAEDATANIYCKSGFHTNEGTHTWAGKDGCSEMHFELDGKYDNLLLELEYETFAPPQQVKIYANEKMIADYSAAGYEQKQIVIAKEYVKDGVLDLKFEFPDAVSPADLQVSSDARKLSLCMYSMCISSTKDQE